MRREGRDDEQKRKEKKGDEARRILFAAFRPLFPRSETAPIRRIVEMAVTEQSMERLKHRDSCALSYSPAGLRTAGAHPHGTRSSDQPQRSRLDRCKPDPASPPSSASAAAARSAVQQQFGLRRASQLSDSERHKAGSQPCGRSPWRPLPALRSAPLACRAQLSPAHRRRTAPLTASFMCAFSNTDKHC